MKPTRGSTPLRDSLKRRGRLLLMLAGCLLAALGSSQAATPLADQPLFSNIAVPGNLVLALSVEFPTAVSVAHQGRFVAGNSYLGYFDPEKCYRYYVGAETGTDLSHFYPVSTAVGRKCTAAGYTDTWSGNFLNWMTMQAIDPFRWALTGGYRVVDTTTTTILERAWATDNSQNGSDTNFPLVPTASGDALKERPSPSSTDIADHTPLSFSSLKVSVRTRGNRVWFTSTATLTSATTGPPTPYSQSITPAAGTIYSFYARVKVCESGAGFSRESNCKPYASAYKPEGLLQQYADKIRFSAFGYLNDPTDDIRDGGVLRARQKFVGPNTINPGSAPTSNAAREWSPTTGVMSLDPDAADAANTASVFGVPVANSGVLNYLNKFGQQEKVYKRRDPVSELYYGALRYLKNQGHVPAWSNIGSDPNKTRLIDGFPVIRDWDDPIQYSCQRNFVLGIGDTNTNWDRNVPGSTTGSSEPTKPAEVTADTTVNAVTATNKVGSLQGMGGSLGTTGISNGSYLIAGLAYDANTKDIRPDVVADANTIGKQTVQTYWLDVLEFGAYVNNNQYYLAAKYGGFKVPEDFGDPYARTAPLDEAWWRTNTDSVGSQPRPDNYYTASRPDQVVEGLTKAFASIASELKAFTTSFSTSLPQVSVAGNASYAARFDAENWTGELTAEVLAFDASTGEPTRTPAWSFGAKLATQLAGTGWDTGRRVITWNPASGTGVPFRSADVSATQLAALDTAYRAGGDSVDYLNYLRGERLHEQASAASGSSKAYRTRTGLMGDVVGSKARPVGPPSLPLSNASNPGYGAFKSTWAARPTVVYVGANDGMLHAIDGALTGTGAGQEIFAYVPSALFSGPTSTPGVNGLAALGNPSFEHHYYVNGTPGVFDIDFNRTHGASGAADWRSVLIGGLGKGGRSYFALDVTNPAGMGSETLAATKVLWEFTDADMGYSYGEPTVVKTAKYGWVVILSSGYNNSNGQGYFFIVNPRTGALLEKIGTGVGSSGSPAGLAHVNAFVLDRSDGVADAAYAGDLLGNLWRLDLTPKTDPYPAPTRIATLTNAAAQAQSVTTRPTIEVDPKTGRRFVLLGTGVMLDNSDIGSVVQNSFYAIVDGKANRFNASADLPATISFPITRDKLADNTNVLDDISYDLATQIGWYIELGTGDSGSVGWRVVSDPTSAFGIITFASTLPSGDACNPSGISRIYALNFGTGKSVLGTADSLISYFTEIDGVVTDLRFFTVNGVPRLIAGSDKGELKSVPGIFNQPGTLRRLNWRELPVAN
jgi:type IV pilus assembly protein PilY1